MTKRLVSQSPWGWDSAARPQSLARTADRKRGGPRFTKSPEQSQNIYENKGEAQKVRWFNGPRLFHDRSDGPLRASVSLWFKSSQNKARMYMKTKEKYKKSGRAGRRFCGPRLVHRRQTGPRPQTRRSTLHEIARTKPECI